MSFTKFDRYVDRHARSFTERLQNLCRMPSVAARGTGMRAIHTVNEWLDVKDMYGSAEMTLEIMKLNGELAMKAAATGA